MIHPEEGTDGRKSVVAAVRKPLYGRGKKRSILMETDRYDCFWTEQIPEI
jgi:hypothetical protein